MKSEGQEARLRYKSRLVVKGFDQKKEVDFEKIFSPVAKMSSIRIVLGLTTSLDLEIE
jgi:Reverse transcriptase (RNA-dependent DNA polymerase)